MTNEDKMIEEVRGYLKGKEEIITFKKDMREKTKKYFSEYNVLESVEHALKTLSTNHKKEIEKLNKLIKLLGDTAERQEEELQTQRDDIFKEIRGLQNWIRGDVYNSMEYRKLLAKKIDVMLEHLKQKHKGDD